MNNKINITRNRQIVFPDDWKFFPKDFVMKLLRNHIWAGPRIYLGSDRAASQMRKWCNENCNGLYYSSERHFYFEEEEDMTGFKLYWDGKDEEE